MTERSPYYDRDGQPISAAQWGALRDSDYLRVALTEIGEIRISTVWIGIDMGWRGGPPMIFETMVFGGPLADEMVRYPTAAEAQAGHDAMVTLVLTALDMIASEESSSED